MTGSDPLSADSRASAGADAGNTGKGGTLALIEVGVVSDARMLAEGLRVWAEDRRDLPFAAWWLTVYDLFADSFERADMVIIDLRFQEERDTAMNVQQLVRANSQVLVISAWPEPEFVAAVLTVSAGLDEKKRQDSAPLVSRVRALNASEATGEVDAAPRGRRPQLSARERDVLAAYASGMTLDAVARQVGIRLGTAKTYLGRVKAKYQEVGRPAYTKLDLATRVREDWA